MILNTDTERLHLPSLRGTYVLCSHLERRVVPSYPSAYHIRLRGSGGISRSGSRKKLRHSVLLRWSK